MKRRAYLAMATAGSLSLAGCTDTSFVDSSSKNGDDGSDSNSEETSNEYSGPTGTDDDFENLDAWTVSGGTLTADPDRALVGSQSARIETTAGGQTTRLAKTFAEPRDLTDVVPGVAATANDLFTPWLRLVDSGGDSVEYRRGITADLPFMRYNFGLESISDGFDSTAVREVQLQFWSGEGQERTVWFDDLHFIPRPETGKVMIQFDDVHVTDHTKALPILEEYGYPAVTFVNPNYLDRDAGGDPRLSPEQLHDLHDAGWCISNHCLSHPRLPELSREEQRDEIRGGKEWLVEQGFEEGAEYFAYPFGQFDETTIELVDEYHEIGFAGGGPVQGYTTNTKLAPRIGEPSAERVRTALERTAEMRGITSVFYHRLEGENLAAFETFVETIHEYESQGDLDVILPQDLGREYLF
ncbi:polysaccharide deacetylase family protein [Natronorubrum halophilum]|uniref:polysaccharide deacetylase family protein n=1 Tax=Natronorubrum halophilum TaxID=1702106 RepID=UPI000EF6BDC4|nr:polysaccharide deacetylase family protein [Natronorubrum halophilum]